MSNWTPRTPYLSVDAVVRIPEGIVLVRRRYPPLGWALPGGFVEVGETVEEAVRREVKEEVNLEITDLWLVGVYSRPGRDPRFHTVSVVFGAQAQGVPTGADDAIVAQAFPDTQLPSDIAFDHLQIITDFLKAESRRGPTQWR